MAPLPSPFLAPPLQRSAVHLLLDMHNTSSPNQVWWKVNPPPSDFYCSAQFFPREYCALLQSRVLVREAVWGQGAF
jgi:hypothetical protein